MQELLVNDFDTKYYKKSSIKAKKLDPGSMTPYLMDFVIYAHRSDYFKDLAISLKTFKESLSVNTLQLRVRKTLQSLERVSITSFI